MGFIKAIAGAVSGTLANQWKEFYTCDSMASDVLIKRAVHMISGRSSNKRSDTDDITKNSVVIVNEGQCAVFVSQGKVIDVIAEAGAYTWNDDTSPSFFSGKFSDTVRHGWERFAFGGQNPVQQRIYYINTKELLGCRFGTPVPVPFRITDSNIGLDMDTSVKCNGTYIIHVSDPVRLYTSIAGNVADVYTADDIDDQLRSEFVQALQPAFADISQQGIRPNELTGQTMEISRVLQKELNPSWENRYGISLDSVQILSAKIPDEDLKTLQDIQKQAVYRNGSMAGAALVQAQAEAMRTAAGNENGAMMGFAGMNMAMNAGGIDTNQFYQEQQQTSASAQSARSLQQAAGGISSGTAGEEWFCPNCGLKNNGNFCPKCGTPKPQF